MAVHTYLQISDLHFGDVDPATGNAKTSQAVRQLAMTYEVFQGSLGHQGQSLIELARYVRKLHTPGERLNLIVTGDYSRCGSDAELQLAYDYIYREIDVRKPRKIKAGLWFGHHGGQMLGVPGNHDQWGGHNSPFSYQVSKFAASRLSKAYPVVTPGPTIGKRDVRFLEIDSDADVLPGTLRRILARGHFLSQLTQLGALLGPAGNPKNELRVLVLHHALHHVGKTLRISAPSAAALAAFMANYDVKILLSGHTHRANTAIVGAGTREICSGSTTQIDAVPRGWTNLQGNTPTVNFNLNSFVVHRLTPSVGGLIDWSTETVQRKKLVGFEVKFKTSYLV